MKLNKQIIFSIGLLLLLAAIFFTPFGGYLKKKIEKSTHISEEKNISKKDFNFGLKGYLGAKDFHFNELDGDVIFLNFWGSWCPPCVEEMPSIQKLYEARGNKVKFVLITMQDKPEKFIPFLEKNNYTIPVYEASSPIPSNLLPKSFPTTYILNKKGEIVSKTITSKDWNAKETHDLLDKLLLEN